MKKIFIVTLLLFVGCEIGNAGDRSMSFGFPTASNFPQPLPFVFPGLGTAAAINASSLPFLDKSRAFQFATSRVLGGGNDYGLYGGFAKASRNWGVGFGYQGLLSNGFLRDGAYAGFAAGESRWALGGTVRSIPYSVNSDFDLNYTRRGRNGLRMTAMVTDILQGAQVAMGAGLEDNLYRLEVGARMPILAPSLYNVGVQGALTVLINRAAVTYSVAYLPTTTVTAQHFMALGYEATNELRLSAQYEVYYSRLTAGITMHF